ncbi:30 kDa heat shock protein [Achaetomium macrosporum]|uniref:30 kDa heat shock protein n=1 Tax=Achaetomium macrosporum TaxID=79813 RepID=A0AAN7C4N4_9PEZI|nr:30 kDa heat shock protein [Achaetomium macrosporum]
MSLFPGSYCAPADTGFTPLFRLLEDFDNYSRDVQTTRPQQPKRARRQPATFHPKFDVRETENTYELHGELPGLERENVNIEFTDTQTLVARGHVERSYGPESSNKANNNNNDAANNTTAEAEKQQPRRNSYQATVEDDPEESPAASTTSTPATSPEMGVAKPVSRSEVIKPAAAAQDEAKYWLWERSVGEFSRAFSFPARVDHDGVTASLNNGILSVTVPKAKKPVTRRIEIA